MSNAKVSAEKRDGLIILTVRTGNKTRKYSMPEHEFDRFSGTDKKGVTENEGLERKQN